MKCPCKSNKKFQECCELFLLGEAKPETAEQLMRSRYTAYVQVNIPYLKESLTKKSRKDFDPESSKKWAEGVEWQDLKITSTKQGGPSDKKGIVEFVATYKQQGEMVEHHEVSYFERNENQEWKFDDGDSHTHKVGEKCDHNLQTLEKIETVVRDTPKVGRNDPCACGSGKKFKKCCA